MATSAGLPGFNTPAVGFEQPFAMLEACHERVERTLTLLSRLRSYLREQAVDDAARQAARDVLRYFDIAAPLHHEDEELHVFPLLLERGRRRWWRWCGSCNKTMCTWRPIGPPPGALWRLSSMAAPLA